MQRPPSDQVSQHCIVLTESLLARTTRDLGKISNRLSIDLNICCTVSIEIVYTGELCNIGYFILLTEAADVDRPTPTLGHLTSLRARQEYISVAC